MDLLAWWRCQHRVPSLSRLIVNPAQIAEKFRFFLNGTGGRRSGVQRSRDDCKRIDTKRRARAAPARTGGRAPPPPHTPPTVLRPGWFLTNIVSGGSQGAGEMRRACRWGKLHGQRAKACAPLTGPHVDTDKSSGPGTATARPAARRYATQAPTFLRTPPDCPSGNPPTRATGSWGKHRGRIPLPPPKQGRPAGNARKGPDPGAPGWKGELPGNPTEAGRPVAT